MEKERLQEIIEKHKKWANDEEGGERMIIRYSDLHYSNFSNCDLCNCELQGSDLLHSDLRNCDLSDSDLRYSDLRHCDLRNSDLSRSDLSHSNLSNADLLGANLDYSCLPLSCGSLSAHFDDRQLIQIAYHLVKAGIHSKNASDETKRELSKLIDFANQFHRVKECGRIERMTENDKV